jgi:spore germination protein YaaH
MTKTLILLSFFFATLTSCSSQQAADSIEKQFDSISASSYLITKEHKLEYRQLFFEDSKSLSIKYDWIKKNQVGGVGIWALGYDNGYSDLWNLLVDKFSRKQYKS